MVLPILFWPRQRSGSAIMSLKGSASYYTSVGSGATIDDLHASNFTAEGWFKVPLIGSVQYLFVKGNASSTGWRMMVSASGFLQATVFCATDAGLSGSYVANNRWHFMKMTYDFSTDRKIRLYVDRVLVGTSTASVGAVDSDAASLGFISFNPGSLQGAHGWARWSNIVRPDEYITRWQPPVVDANTVAQWNVVEGSGTAVADSSGNNNNGTINVGTWMKIK